MNDEERLEAELAGMRPAALRGELTERLAAATERLTPGDRMLAAWTGMGALAACVIVGVAVWQMAMVPRVPAGTEQRMAARQNLAAEMERLIASR